MFTKVLLKNYVILLIILLIVNIFTIIFTWPFVLKLNSFYRDYGDSSFNSWVLWYTQNSIITGKIFGQGGFYNAPQFYPVSNSLAFSDNLLIPSLIFLPIYHLLNNFTLSINVFIFLSFTFCFLSAFYSIRSLVKSTIPSIIGSLVFTFNPLTLEHLYAGHIQLLNKLFLLPSFLFGVKYLNKPTINNALLFVIFFSLNALSSIYFEIYSALTFLTLGIIFICLNMRRKNLPYTLKLAKTSLVFIPFLLSILYFQYPYLEFSKNEIVTRSLSQNIYFSAKPADWISPMQTSYLYHFIATQLESSHASPGNIGFYLYQEHTLLPTITGIALAIAGLYYLRRFKSQIRIEILYSSLLITLIYSFVMTFGPFFTIGNSLIPVFPNILFYLITPFMSATRVPSRFEFIFYIPFSILVSFGALYLGNLKIFSSTSFRKVLFSLVIVIFLIAENLVVWNWDETSFVSNNLNYYQTKYPKLVASLKEKVILHLPYFTYQDDLNANYLTWSRITGETLVNGYSGYTSPEWQNMITNINDNFNLNSLRILKTLGVDFVIIHKLDYPTPFQKYPTNLNIQKLSSLSDNNIDVLDLSKINKVSTCNSQIVSKLTIKRLNNERYAVEANNFENCYIISKYNQRYLDFNPIDNPLHNPLHLVLPIIIAPYQKILIRTAYN